MNGNLKQSTVFRLQSFYSGSLLLFSFFFWCSLDAKTWQTVFSRSRLDDTPNSTRPVG